MSARKKSTALKLGVDRDVAVRIGKDKHVRRCQKESLAGEIEVHNYSKKPTEKLIGEIENENDLTLEDLLTHYSRAGKISTKETQEEEDTLLSIFGENGTNTIIIPVDSAPPLSDTSKDIKFDISALNGTLLDVLDENYDPYILLDALTKSTIQRGAYKIVEALESILEPMLYTEKRTNPVNLFEIMNFCGTLKKTVLRGEHCEFFESEPNMFYSVQHIESDIFLINGYKKKENDCFMWTGYYFCAMTFSMSTTTF